MAHHFAKKKASRSGKGKGGSPFFTYLAYAALAAVIAGLVLVVYPFVLSPGKAKNSQPVDTARQIHDLSTQHPDAEVLNPGSSAPSTKKK